MLRKVLGMIGLGAIIAAGFSGAAAASTFVWKDPVNDFTFSFPDSWSVQTDDVPTTRVRIAGPVPEDLATCRVKAQKDNRLQIYPKHLMTQAVFETLDRSFWEEEAAGNEEGVITDYHAPTSLGNKGDATAIKTAFVQRDGDDRKIYMYGQMIGSIYADTRYVISCSSKAAEYKKYAPVFASILGSINLESKYHPFATGYYRDFLADPKLMLPRSKPGTIHEKNAYTLRRITN